MRELIFDEDQLNDLDSIRKRLFENEADPRSITYKRQLERPRINWVWLFFAAVFPLLCFVPLAIGLKFAGLGSGWAFGIASIAVLVYYMIIAKPLAITGVKIYQRFAPASVRNKCRFEPSCSQYMILSIEKYGLLRGVKKGANRLKRCNIDDGGFDYP